MTTAAQPTTMIDHWNAGPSTDVRLFERWHVQPEEMPFIVTVSHNGATRRSEWYHQDDAIQAFLYWVRVLNQQAQAAKREQECGCVVPEQSCHTCRQTARKVYAEQDAIPF